MLFVLPFLACAPPAPGDIGHGDGSDAPTWHQDVAPIVSEACTSCHEQGGIAPFTLSSYDDAAPMATAIAEAVESRRMPPWGAQTTEECTPRVGFSGDQRLADEEIAIVVDWAEAGAPEGDPATAAPLVEPQVPTINDDLSLFPTTPHLTAGDTDQILCRPVDPGFTETTWVTGVEVLPGDLSVVHHVVVYVDPHAESDALVDDNGTYDCFSAAGVSDETALAVWVPGAYPTVPPENSGFPVAAGSRLVLQMHYHPAGSTGTPDTTGVRLDITTEAPRKTAYLTGVGNAAGAAAGLLPGDGDRGSRAEFRVPANAPDHVESMDIDLPTVKRRYDVWSVEAHMHMVGVDMLATVEHTDPEVGIDEECLLHEPAWDFDWQRLYSYDGKGVTIGEGDIIHLRCEYDNTLANPGVVRALDDAGLDEPTDVFLGESSYDEMCVLIFGITY